VKLRKRKAAPFEGPDYDTLIKRAQSMDASQVIEAMEISLSSITRYVGAYRATRDATLLEELKMSAQAFYVLADTLVGREDGYGNPVAPAKQVRRY
jgi:hypothetical protein